MINKSVYILGIESSCDDTGVSIVNNDRSILTNIVLSSIEDNSPYKGVVPEIAARSHLSYIRKAIESALKEAKLTLGQIDAIAATAGPGLIGGVWTNGAFTVEVENMYTELVYCEDFDV